MQVYIPLTQGRRTLVDKEDFEYLSQWKWYFIKDGYAVRSDYSNGRLPKQIKMHRLIMGEPKGLQVDHKNTNKLDNRKSNLRIATINQNQQNSGIQKNNTSGYKGVSRHSLTKKWKACLQIKIDGEKRNIYLGLYANPRDGAKAYNRAARKYFGEFARLNKI